jgi:hypothetical protein
MTGLKMLAAAALLSAISATSALAQQETARLAQFPDRDWLNGGVLTPAARQALERSGGAAGNSATANSYAGVDSAGPAVRNRRLKSSRR